MGKKKTACRLLVLLTMVSWPTVSLSTRPAEAAPPGEAGVATAVAGPVTLTRPFAFSHPLKVDQGLYWRDVIETPKNATTQLRLEHKTTVTVRELSRLELRKEHLTTGVRYVVELLSGKVRMSVDRALMRPGDQVQVRTWNAVASVRGTEFIVETAGDSTTVHTLTGVVEVTNRGGALARVERIGAYEAARVSGDKAPTRSQFAPHDLDVALQGLTPPEVEPTTIAVSAEPPSSAWNSFAPLVAGLLLSAALVSFLLTAWAYSPEAARHGGAYRHFSSR